MIKRIYFDDFLKEQLKDPEFKKEWERGEPAYQVGRELIRSRIEAKISQRQLAKRANTTQAVVSRIENMSVSPTISLVQKLAEALGKKVEIKFA